ncbi:MAG: hypothetical protein NTZ16_07765, partial [Verrucomicrobia bacterium]|nr:hypothetical protein [Verrucomicrobiota bacterium]
PAAAAPADASAAPPQLPEELPIAMTFRGSDGLHADAFEQRMKETEPFQVIHAPGDTDKSAAVQKRWPAKVVTMQLAYGGIGGDLATRAWPGHFLYKTGTKLTRDLRPGDNVLRVEDLKVIGKDNSEAHNEKFPHTLTLYALDSYGRPDWSRAEHVTLLKIMNGSVIVQRGQWGTKPQTFSAGRAVVAGHMMFWTRQFMMNLSLHCPRGGPGNLTAAEWLAREWAAKVKEAGVAGMEMDVGRWTWGFPKTSPMDCNNDLKTDHGYIAGVNSFGLGGQILFRELRRQLGPDKIIQVDSNGPIFGCRGWNYLNGVQLECFPAENRFELFSEAFAHLRRWVDSAQATPRYSYGFTKTPTTVYSKIRQPDGSPTDFHFRVGLAADCLLGMPHPFASIEDIAFDPANESEKEPTEVFGVFKWDEYFGGDLNNWHWLGKPLAPARQFPEYPASAADLLAGVNWKWKTTKGFDAACEQTDGFSAATVKRIPEGALPTSLWFGVELTTAGGKPLNLKPNTEYTLEFDARGGDTWIYAGQTLPRVPRMVAIRGIGEAMRTGEASSSVLAEAQWYRNRISMTTPAKPDSEIAFGVSEQIGRTELRNLRLVEGGAERWSRDFEHGKILLNMTRHPWKVDVGSGYRRLKGMQCPEVNTGAKVNGEITVPAWDAVFLVKE